MPPSWIGAQAGARGGSSVARSVRLRSASGLLIGTIALSVLALLWRFAAEPIEHGYTRYAGLAAEMLRSGDWAVMRAAGQLYLNKPPLYVWLIAGPMSVLGRTSAFAQHAPDVLAFALTLGFTWAFARRWFGAGTAGPSAALVVASSVGFSFLTRGKRIDPLLTAWLTGSFYFAWRALEATATRREQLGGMLASQLLLALAALTKGPLAFALWAAVIVPYALWRRRGAQLVSRASLAGLALALALVALWPALIVHELGVGGVVAGLSQAELARRVGSVLYYAGELPVQWLPWSLLLPAIGWLLWTARRSETATESAALAFASFWLAGVLLPLHLTHLKHYRYALPAFPALALLVVALWHHPAAARLRERGRWAEWLRTGPVALLLATAALAALLAPLALALRPEWRGAAPWAALPLAGAGLAGLSGLARLWRAADPRGAFERAVVAVALAAIAADGAFVHAITHDARSAEMRQALAPLVRGEPALGYRLTIGAWSRILLVSGVSLDSCSASDQVVSWLRAVPGGEGWVVTSRKARKRLPKEPGFTVQHEPVEQAGLLLIAVADPARAPVALPPQRPAPGSPRSRSSPPSPQAAVLSASRLASRPRRRRRRASAASPSTPGSCSTATPRSSRAPSPRPRASG